MKNDREKWINMTKLVLNNWDNVGLDELCDKDKYLYSLSVVLSEAYRRQSNTYDHKIIYDLLLGKKTQNYTLEIFDVFLDDLKVFSQWWAETKTNYVDENKSLIAIFDKCLPRFAAQSHFDFLKSHWLLERIHRPLLAVLRSRAKEWRKDSFSADIKENILDILY